MEKCKLSTGIINISDFHPIFNTNMAWLSTKFIGFRENTFLTSFVLIIYNFLGVFKKGHVWIGGAVNCLGLINLKIDREKRSTVSGKE